jgi:hypothetical protein
VSAWWFCVAWLVGVATLLGVLAGVGMLVATIVNTSDTKDVFVSVGLILGGLSTATFVIRQIFKPGKQN